ncbi:hypothetical protein [Bacteroides nordii]|uniref:hypothetical protein n=1 Tax=Bacteroides nordii TaxID=291645 RepID=UPI00241DA838|nr:hypothetical protein [Bacteroides nordii]MBD9112602.1 hypothetical protein [Bacteroides nordii]
MKNILRIFKRSKSAIPHYLTVITIFCITLLMAGCNPDPVEQEDKQVKKLENKQEDKQGEVLEPSINDWKDGSSAETDAKEK